MITRGIIFAETVEHLPRKNLQIEDVEFLKKDLFLSFGERILFTIEEEPKPLFSSELKSRLECYVDSHIIYLLRALSKIDISEPQTVKKIANCLNKINPMNYDPRYHSEIYLIKLADIAQGWISGLFSVQNKQVEKINPYRIFVQLDSSILFIGVWNRKTYYNYISNKVKIACKTVIFNGELLREIIFISQELNKVKNV